MREAAVIAYDARGVVRGWNRGACSLFGYDRAEAMGRSVSALIGVAEGSPVADLTTEEDALEVDLLTRRGEHVLALRTRAPIRDARGDVVACVDVLQPIEHEWEVAEGREARGHATTQSAKTDGDRPFRQFADTLPQMVWTADASGLCDYPGERWRAYTGAPAEGLYGWGWLMHVHPDDRESTADAWNRSVASCGDFHVEYRARRHDGVYRWFDVRARPLRDEAGRVVKWFGSSTEVHEAREIRHALERERDRLQRLLATAPGIPHSYRVAPDGSITYPFSGPGVESIYGVSAEELARDASPVWTSILPEDVEAVRRDIALSASTMSMYRGEYRIRNPTRGVLWLEVHATPKREADGAYTWVGFMRDITERKRALESLRTTQAQLVAALEAGRMGLSTWDVARDELHVDALLLKLLERRRDELCGTSVDTYAFAHPDDVGVIKHALEQLAASGATQSFEHRVVCPDGSVKWLSVRAHCECDADSKVARVTALHADVTHQKRMTEAQLHAQKLESLGTLASGIAHDFNNILQAITGNTTLALCRLPSEHPARSFLDAVTVAARRASELVRRILAFSRPIEQALQILSLDAVIAEALKLVRSTLPATIELRAALGGPAPKVAVDATQIHQIILNLTTNAAHAIGPRAGVIEVQLGAARQHGRTSELPPELSEGAYAVLHVSDDGAGMAPTTLQRIFDPFYTTKPVGQGTGLGLSVVHGIMKSLGGAVSVRSELGRGTTFSLYFPAASGVPVVSSKPPPEPETAVTAGERILLVDDEPMLVTLGTTLLKMLGYRPTGKNSPLDALRSFEQAPHDFDLVITDVAMPELSGFDLVERLRARRADLPIVMVSGYVGPEERERAQRIGIRELLVKPVSIADLQHAVARALEDARTRTVTSRERRTST